MNGFESVALSSACEPPRVSVTLCHSRSSPETATPSGAAASRSIRGGPALPHANREIASRIPTSSSRSSKCADNEWGRSPCPASRRHRRSYLMRSGPAATHPGEYIRGLQARPGNETGAVSCSQRDESAGSTPPGAWRTRHRPPEASASRRRGRLSGHRHPR